MTDTYTNVRMYTKSYERFRKRAFKKRRPIIKEIDAASIEKKPVKV